MPTWNQRVVTNIAIMGALLSSPGLSAGLDQLSKSKPEAPVAKPAKETKPMTTPTAEQPTQSAPKVVTPPEKPTPATPPTAAPKVVPLNKKSEEVEDEDEKAAAPAKKPSRQSVVQSQASKAIENRLSLATSLGWALVTPAKGSWIGVGASDVSARWRESIHGDGKAFITVRYAPVAGVWKVDDRDYDTSLHGIYGGVEYQKPVEFLAAPTIKAGVELGYMLVYARPQDEAEAADDVKGGKFNLTVGGGADWDILDGKVKVGPFARLHLLGFTIVNVGGSVNFVF